MRRRFVLVIVLAGLVTAGSGRAQQAQESALSKPPAKDIGFAKMPEWSIDVPDLSDVEVKDLLATLERLLAQESDATKWKSSASIPFWRFQARLERGRMTRAQEATVATYFDALAAIHPADKAYIERRKWAALNIGIGRTAPDITGKDFDGATFSLNEYRGKVVYLVFTGEWCAPCRSEYPYQRLMLELYKDKPFALLGVNSDAKLETARQGKVDSKLPNRSWWDGHEKESTKGPIAATWGVTAWPTIYILDATGAIRFADLRHEDSLKAVAQLMAEKR